MGRSNNSRSPNWTDYKFDIPRVIQKLGLQPEQDGDELTVSCPFHKEGSRPNLGINANTGLWQCWSCGEKGNLPGLVSKLRQISYKEAVRYLIDYGEVPTIQELKDELKRDLDRLLTKSQKIILPTFDVSGYNVSQSWWLRYFPREIIRRYSLGFDPQSRRAVVPVRFNGRWVGTIKRAVNKYQTPKYLYDRGFDRGKVLYPWDFVPKNSSACILVEGSRDALRCHMYGRTETLAVLGSGITAAQLALLINTFDEVTVWMDNDIYGHMNNLLVAETLTEYVPRVYVAPYAEEVKDQFELTKEGTEKSLKHRIHWTYLL